MTHITAAKEVKYCQGELVATRVTFGFNSHFLSLLLEGCYFRGKGGGGSLLSGREFNMYHVRANPFYFLKLYQV